MAGGLTIDGFIAPTVEELVTDLNTRFLANIDAGLDLAPDQPFGQVVGILAEKFAEVWELQATLYNALNPDAAEGRLLDNVSAISGSRRRSATYSLVTATVNLNGSGTTLPAGTIASVANQPNNRWVLLTPVTNSTLIAANFTSYWRSEQPGPFSANSATLTVKETPVVGWNTISNPADGIPGIPQDTDAVLRVERENELTASGSGTDDSVRAKVLLVTGVVQCYVYENDTMVTDADGIPPKSYRVVIWDGIGASANNAEIAQTIWNSKPSGVSTYGAVAANAVDSRGNSRVVYFDRAIQVPIYLSVTTTPGTTPGQRTAVKAAMAAYALATQNLGVDVVALAYRAEAITVAGITDAPTLTLGIAPSPVGTGNITISGLQIATISTTNILVNGS